MAVTDFSDRPDGFNEYKNHLGETVRIDPTKAHNLLALVEAAMDTGGDVVLIYDGEEGSTKSTQAMQDAALLDKTITEKRIEFSPEQAVQAHFRGLPDVWDPKIYVEGGYDNKPWESIILDESAKLDRKRTMSSGSVEFTGFLTQSRQLHKIFFIVLPNVHMLDSYITEHRAVALIHCYKYEKTHLGFYMYYTREHLKIMFNSDMHKRKLYPNDPAFQGRANRTLPFDTTQYDKKKAAALRAYRRAEGLEDTKDVDPVELRQRWENEALKICMEKNLKDSSVYQALRIPKRTWYERRKALQISLGIELIPKRGTASRVLMTPEAYEQTLEEEEHSVQ